jgi:hypothetical protein
MQKNPQEQPREKNNEEELGRIPVEQGGNQEEDLNPEKNEKDIEKDFEGKKFKINTVSDFINSIKYTLSEKIEDDDQKNSQQLWYQIHKIDLGLKSAQLSADKVRVKRMPDGVLGMYDPNGKQISIDEDLLEDFNTNTQLFKTVFVHEKTHYDGIADEGLTQIRVRKKISATPGIYESEVAKAKRAFYLEGVDKVIELYEMKHPDKLMDYYLETELKKKFKKNDLVGHDLNIKTKSQATIYKDRFKKGAPRLFDKLKQRNYKFSEKILELFKEIVQ